MMTEIMNLINHNMVNNKFKPDGESALLNLRSRILVEKQTVDKHLNLNALRLSNKDIKITIFFIYFCFISKIHYDIIQIIDY